MYSNAQLNTLVTLFNVPFKSETELELKLQLFPSVPFVRFKFLFKQTIAIAKLIVITIEANDTIQQMRVIVNRQLPSKGAIKRGKKCIFT